MKALIRDLGRASAEFLTFLSPLLQADDGSRTRDLRLGKPTLYQLSYVRVEGRF